jgi:hypothetical protein
MLTIRAMSDGKGYSSRHLEHSDYYAEGERVTGVWQGRGAELLGLRGAVKTDDFEALRQGLDPRTNEFLRVRHSADRTAVDGTKLAQGRSLYDFTISAPKSVSVLAILAGDDRLIEAHRIAVAEALEEAEKYAASRVRQAGANENGRPQTWRSPFTTTTPAASLIRSCTHMRSRLISHSTARKATGRRCKRRRFMSAGPIFPRSTAMRLLAKLAPWVTRSRTSVTRRDEIPGSRSGASRRSYSQSSASAAVNAMRQLQLL